jgi:hypothetical protein
MRCIEITIVGVLGAYYLPPVPFTALPPLLEMLVVGLAAGWNARVTNGCNIASAALRRSAGRKQKSCSRKSIASVGTPAADGGYNERSLQVYYNVFTCNCAPMYAASV